MHLGKTLIAVARTRAALFAGVASACFAAAMIYAAFAPDMYRAVATVFFEPGTVDFADGEGIGPAVRGKNLDLLRSERVAQRVVENERLVREPAMRTLYLRSIDAGREPQEALAQYLAAHVDAGAPGGASDGGLVQLAVVLEDAALAARVANAYARAWGEVSLELRAESIREGIERANRSLAALRARLGEARARRRGDAELAAIDPRTQAEFAQLSRLATQPLAGGRDAPGGIADASEPARAAAAVLPPGPSIDVAPRAAAARVPSGAPRDAASAEDEIRVAQQSLERAEERMARLSAEGIGAPFPAHLLRPAAAPDAPTKPGLGACSAIGLAFGVLLGLAAVALAELFDRRIRRPSDLARATGVVVLGSLPAAARVSVRGRHHGELLGWRAGQVA